MCVCVVRLFAFWFVGFDGSFVCCAVCLLACLSVLLCGCSVALPCCCLAVLLFCIVCGFVDLPFCFTASVSLLARLLVPVCLFVCV